MILTCNVLGTLILKKIANIQVIREGSDITLVGWGAQLSIMEQACLDAEKVCYSQCWKTVL